MLGLDIILGGLTGLIGSVTTSITNYKMQKLKNEHDREMIQLESEAMREEAKMQIAIKKVEIEGAIELADTQAFVESQKTSNVSLFSEKWIDKLFAVEGWAKFVSVPFGVLIASGFALVDFLRGFMRPALTIYLSVMTSVITWMAWDILNKHNIETMTVQQAIVIYNDVTSIVVYLTVSCVTWWFSDRQTAKFIQSMGLGKKK